ncbi:MAG: anaerobic sulfatase maturase [FCB group bacterium]|nr:anaerobic sulfatase maturase [FCB group bacterium]
MKPFSLLIKPTSADCNLHCKYCFYLDRNTLYPESKRHRMSDKVLEQMISGYMSTRQPQYIFNWQGGEPTLMGTTFFQKVIQLQQKYGKRGVSVSNSLQTNATLINDELAQILAQYNFLVGVSLDGPADVHDQNRLTIKGRGSHKDVLDGIECLNRNKVEFNILTLVNSANVKNGRELYRYLRDMGLVFHQYIPCVEFDGNDKPLPFTITADDWGTFLCDIFDEWSRTDTRKVSVRLFDSILAVIVDGVYTECSMDRNCCQYFVVEYNGDVFPCDFYVESDLKLGNIMEDSWEALLQSSKYSVFGQQKTAWNPACSGCEYLQYCSGDCLKHRQNNRPQGLSWLCAGWKQFYQHSISDFQRLAGEIIKARKQFTRQGSPSTIGRNQPCPCGSGKKYKKCCGRSVM